MKKTRKSLQASTGSKQLSLLPELDFTPKWPTENTLSHRALGMMLQGKCISHPDFEGETDSWRLAAHVHRLYRLGWPIKTRQVCFYATSKPCKRRILEYYLPKEIIEKVKQSRGGSL